MTSQTIFNFQRPVVNNAISNDQKLSYYNNPRTKGLYPLFIIIIHPSHFLSRKIVILQFSGGWLKCRKPLYLKENTMATPSKHHDFSQNIVFTYCKQNKTTPHPLSHSKINKHHITVHINPLLYNQIPYSSTLIDSLTLKDSPQ